MRQNHFWTKAVLATVLTALLLTAFGTVSFAKTTITLMSHWSKQQEDQISPYFREYEKLNPDIKIEFQPVQFSELLKKIMVSRLAGVRPDIYHVYNLWLPNMVENGVIAPTSPDVTKLIRNDYSGSAVAGVTLNNKIWGVPTEINSYALVYNKRLLDAAGVEPPTTWAELLAASKKLTKKDASGNVVQAGFAMRPGDVSGVVHPFMAFLWSNGGEILNEAGTKAAINSPQALEALKFFVDLISTPHLNSYDDFVGERVAMIAFAPWGKLYFKGQMGEGVFDKYVRSAPMPKSPNGQATVQYGWSFVVDRQSKNAEEAWKFLHWLDSEKTANGATRMGTYLATTLGAIPSNKGDIAAYDDILSGPYMKAFIDSLEFARPEPQLVPANEIKKIVATEVEAAVFGTKTPEQALADAEDKINDVLADY